MAKIQDFLPKKENVVIGLQVKIPRSVALKAKQLMKMNHLNWSELVTACLQSFISEKETKN